MRRIRALDLALLGTLLPLWLACVWTSVVVGLRGGQLRLPLIVRSAESADAYPTVWATAWPAELPTSAVRVGDEIRRANERDLRGRNTLVTTMLMMRAARASESRSPVLTFARGGESFEVRVAPVPRRDWWSLLPFSFACVGAVTFVLLRRPDWRFARRFFVAGVWGGCGFLYFYGFEPASAAAFLLSQLVAVPLAMSLALDFAIELVRGGRPRTRWQAALPWVWGIAYSGQFAVVILWAPPFSLRGYFVLRAALITVYTVALLAALVRGYRASAAPQRRQLRCVVYGLVVGVTPLFVSYALPAFGIHPAAQRIAYFAGSLALAAIPLGILVAIVWFDLLDVDRLISATASYTILGIGGFAVLFAAAPALAGVATDALGVSASGAQLAIAVLLAGVVVPTQRVLRRRLDRLFFADQHDVERAIGSLIEDLARAASLEEIVALTGERLLALLRPESIVLYAREHESFAPVFVRGTAAPSAFPASSPLLGALATRTVPLAAEHWSHDARRAESPFECAALEALGAALVVPLRQRDSLAAFVALGPKRSGDVYTPTDRALLGALAARIAERLGRLGEAEFRREAEAMQSALRRYVPGAVAARVDRGEELPSGERDVSVLFVDIRGYTSLSERLGAAHIFSAINRYTECVSTRIDEHGGSVVEFHGDGLLAVFGAPDLLPDKERAAVTAAREIASAVRVLSFEQGGTPLSIGVGIATGPAFVGNVRGHDREIWAVLGNTTNLAARLQSLTRELDAVIAIDAATRSAAGDACADFTPSQAVAIRGRSEPIDVWLLR